MSTSLQNTFSENKMNMNNLFFEKNLALTSMNFDENMDCESSYISTYNDNDNLKYDSNIIIIDTESEILAAQEHENASTCAD